MIFRATLIGATSWAYSNLENKCDALFAPTVYARVTEVLKWIKENTDGACTSKGKRLEDYNFKSETGRIKRSQLQLLDHDETYDEMIDEEKQKDEEKYNEIDDRK